jgi:hypothetical protein
MELQRWRACPWYHRRWSSVNRYRFVQIFLMLENIKDGQSKKRERKMTMPRGSIISSSNTLTTIKDNTRTKMQGLLERNNARALSSSDWLDIAFSPSKT